MCYNNTTTISSKTLDFRNRGKKGAMKFQPRKRIKQTGTRVFFALPAPTQATYLF